MKRAMEILAGVVGFACGVWFGLSLGLGPDEWMNP